MSAVKAPLIAIAFVLIVLAVIAMGNSVSGFFKDLFSPAPRVVINGVTPAEIKVSYYYRVVPDGPYRKVATDKQGLTTTHDFGPDGWCVTGCEDTTPISIDQTIRLTSLAPGREVRFTLRECRVREGLFRRKCT